MTTTSTDQRKLELGSGSFLYSYKNLNLSDNMAFSGLVIPVENVTAASKRYDQKCLPLSNPRVVTTLLAQCDRQIPCSHVCIGTQDQRWGCT
jgi:hypothetical protein